MVDATGLVVAAAGGDAESLRQLLMHVQRSLRLSAAIFLPNLREVDTVVLRMGTVMASSLADVPLGDPLPWLRARLRELITQRLDELEHSPVASNDPVQRLLLSSGRERLVTVPVDADSVTAITGRVRFMTKGATDLLALRFTNGKSFAQIAEQRLMSLDDVSLALQTACRQLDWTGDASGGTLEPADYRAIDAMTGSHDVASGEFRSLRSRILDHMGLAMRVVLAARLHLIAAAWYAPELAVEKPVLPRAQPPAPAVSTRRFSKIQAPIREVKPGGRSTPTRRQLVLRNDNDKRVPTIDAAPVRSSRSGLITTLIGIALVIGGVAFFLQHNSPKELPALTPATTPAPPQKPPETISTTSPTGTPVAPVEPRESNSIVPIAIVEPPIKAIFPSDASPAPLAVWSTRRLVAGYSGPLLRVRRSGDSAENDFTANASGFLDTAALKKFTSRSSAHVMCWYDQSGNDHHLRQEDKNKQPRIIVDGDLQVGNTRPVITFDRTRFEHFSTPSAIPLGCLYAVVTVRPHSDGAQGLFGSLAKSPSERDAYYPIVDRNGNGHCEWWVGLTDGKNAGSVRKSITRDRLLLWHSSSDGQTKPKLVLRLDGKEVGSFTCSKDALVPIGPTTVGCVYWKHALSDPFGGSLGEMFVLPPGSSNERREEITRELKSYWKTP